MENTKKDSPILIAECTLSRKPIPESIVVRFGNPDVDTVILEYGKDYTADENVITINSRVMNALTQKQALVGIRTGKQRIGSA